MDALSFVVLHLASGHVSGLAFRAALVAAIAACLLASWWIARSNLVNRARLPGLLAVPVALLTLMSVVAAREVRIASDRDHEFFLGFGAPDWIDRHTASPTLLFDEGSFYWNDYWHQAYWNRRVAGVLAVAPGRAPLPGRVDARLHEDGSITNQLGQPVRASSLVTSNSITVVGTAQARLVRAEGSSRLILWNAEQPLRLRYRIRGTPLGRSSSGPFDIDVFDCQRNALRVLLRGSTAPAIVRYSAGASAPKVSVVAGGRWTPVWVALRREPGARMCVAHFEPASMVDIGTIAHVDASRSIVRGA